MNIIYLIALTIFDVIFWHWLHEVKKWNLGWELIYKGRPIYPIYRTVQGILDLGALYLLYPDWIQLGGFILAWYLMFKEYLYYILIWDWQGMLNYENNNADVYWLKRFYFSGWWLLQKYTFPKFTLSFIIALLILLFSNIRIF